MQWLESLTAAWANLFNNYSSFCKNILKARDALNALANSVTLTEYESGAYESGRRFEKIVRFATVDTVRAGWMVKDAGIWTLTEEGLKALKSFPDPLDFYREAARLYRQWHKSHKGAKSSTTPVSLNEEIEIEDESEKSVSVSYEEAREQAQSAIDGYLHAMNGYDFQKLVAELLQAMGYRTILSPHGGDSGIDITAYKDELPPRIVVQVKSQDGDIKETTIPSLKGAMREGDYGLFVTLSNYTKNAQKYLDNTPIIRGINGTELVDLVLKYYDQLSVKYRKMIPLKMVYIPVPPEE